MLALSIKIVLDSLYGLIYLLCRHFLTHALRPRFLGADLVVLMND